MYVDAIEDKKIVRVSEEYAKREGLLIIRKVIDSPVVQPVPLVQLRRAERRLKPQIEEFRRPLDYRKNNVIQELKENFQWDISKKRRELGMSRRQLAFKIGESEDSVISLENGLLPKDNFVLLNKVESALGINLHKSSVQSQSLPKQPSPKPENVPESISGGDIELE